MALVDSSADAVVRCSAAAMSVMDREARVTSALCSSAPWAMRFIDSPTCAARVSTPAALPSSAVAESATDSAVCWMEETSSRRLSCIMAMATASSSRSSRTDESADGHAAADVTAADLEGGLGEHLEALDAQQHGGQQQREHQGDDEGGGDLERPVPRLAHVEDAHDGGGEGHVADEDLEVQRHQPSRFGRPGNLPRGAAEADVFTGAAHGAPRLAPCQGGYKFLAVRG